MIRGNCVEDEVEAERMLLHFVGIAGDNDFIGTETERILLLARRSG